MLSGLKLKRLEEIPSPACLILGWMILTVIAEWRQETALKVIYLIYYLPQNSFLDVGVTRITTKTGTSRSSGTNDNVSMGVCDGNGTCCSTVLNNPGDDRKVGRVDTYTNPKGLGECFTTAMRGPIRATLSKDGSDGWYVNWAQVQLAKGVFHTCNFTSWLDDASGYSREMTVDCNESKKMKH